MSSEDPPHYSDELSALSTNDITLALQELVGYRRSQYLAYEAVLKQFSSGQAQPPSHLDQRTARFILGAHQVSVVEALHAFFYVTSGLYHISPRLRFRDPIKPEYLKLDGVQIGASIFDGFLATSQETVMEQCSGFANEVIDKQMAKLTMSALLGSFTKIERALEDVDRKSRYNILMGRGGEATFFSDHLYKTWGEAYESLDWLWD